MPCVAETASTPTSPIGDQVASPPADTKGSIGPPRKLLTKDQARKLGRGAPAPKSPPPSEPYAGTTPPYVCLVAFPC